MKAINQARQRYLAMAPREQAMFLGRVAAELTVLARDTYRAGSDDVNDPARLRTFNEMLHRVVVHQNHLLSGNKSRYPDEVLFDILRGFAEVLGIESQFASMLSNGVVRSAKKPAARSRRGTRARGSARGVAPVSTS